MAVEKFDLLIIYWDGVQHTVTDVTGYGTVRDDHLFYDMNNDPYSRIREDRQQKMQSIFDEISSKKGLFLTTGKRKDIINASAQMIQYSLNPSYDIGMDIKMIKRKKKVLELYGL